MSNQVMLVLLLTVGLGAAALLVRLMVVQKQLNSVVSNELPLEPGQAEGTGEVSCEEDEDGYEESLYDEEDDEEEVEAEPQLAYCYRVKLVKTEYSYAELELKSRNPHPYDHVFKAAMKKFGKLSAMGNAPKFEPKSSNVCPVAVNISYTEKI